MRLPGESMQNKRLGIKPDARDHLYFRSLCVGSNSPLALERLIITQKFPLLDRKDSNGLFEFWKVAFNIQGGVNVSLQFFGMENSAMIHK